MNYRLLKTLGFGFGATLVAMVALPVIAKAARPLVKGIIKEGIKLKEQVKEECNETKNET